MVSIGENFRQLNNVKQSHQGEAPTAKQTCQGSLLGPQREELEICLAVFPVNWTSEEFALPPLLPSLQAIAP